MQCGPRLLCFLSLVLVAPMVAQAPQPAPHHQTAKASAPAGATAPSSTSKLPSEEVVNAFMRQMFGYDSALSWKISDIKPSAAEGLAEVDIVIVTPQGTQPNRFYVTEDGGHAVAGEILPFGSKPFAAAEQKLKQNLTGPAKGPATAPVTIVEFSDLQCPHCKAVQPTIERLLAEDKNVRLVFQHFPIPGHEWAEKGAEYADCIAQSSNDAVWKFLESVYNAQTEITASNADEKFTAYADQAGVKGSEIAACSAKAETAGRVQKSVLLGRSVNVNATPTLFINGRKIDNVSGTPYDVLKKMADFAATDKK